MTVLSALTIQQLCLPDDCPDGESGMITPFIPRSTHEETGTTFGLSLCGYDVRLDQDVILSPDYTYLFHDGSTIVSPFPLGGHGSVDLTNCREERFPRTFALASTMERFHMPNHVVGIVHDKSTWARRGLAVQNTVIEPGWRGYLTLELSLHGEGSLLLPRGAPIAQVIFHRLDRATDTPYDGKYQDQERGPQVAR